jgi:hypothetical protein
MPETEEIKKLRIAQTAARDLSKFSLYYLNKYDHIPVITANICMFAGLSNIEQIIQLFGEGRQNELLKLPHCTKGIIAELKKLCDEFSDPLTNQKFFTHFAERLVYYEDQIKKEKIRDKKKLADKKVRDKAIENWDKLDKSILENYDLKTFIEEQKLSQNAANKLCMTAGFTNVKQVFEILFPKPHGLFYLKGIGELTLKEIEKACYDFLEKISAQPQMSSVPYGKTKMGNG